MLESAFQKKVLNYLKYKVGGHWINIHGSSYQTSGEPDVVGCYQGKFYAFELKRPDGKGVVSARQRLKLSKIMQEGGVAMVVDNMKQLEELFGQEDT